MATSLGLPLLTPGDSIVHAWQMMIKAGVCAVLVGEPSSSLSLLEEDPVWAALQQKKQTVAEVAVKKSVAILTLQSLSGRSPGEMAVLIPDVASPTLALFFADAGTLGLYGVAPKLRFCTGPDHHPLPPSSNLASDGTCAQCKNPF